MQSIAEAVMEQVTKELGFASKRAARNRSALQEIAHLQTQSEVFMSKTKARPRNQKPPEPPPMPPATPESVEGEQAA